VNDHTIVLDESQRQAVLLALAHLALERPGWDYMLSIIAGKMDNQTPEGRPAMYEEFKRMHRPGQFHSPSDVPAGLAGLETSQFIIAPDGAAITCKTCQRTSYNLNDVRNGYCGFCKVFHDLPTV
jgi:hypothetical protein